jgi:hypothetical protein
MMLVHLALIQKQCHPRIKPPSQAPSSQSAALHKTANVIECARSDIMSEPLDVGQYPLYIY